MKETEKNKKIASEIMRKDRDEYIDFVRGFAMMWVIFIHVLYWTGVFTGYPIRVIKSFFLFEMPLFFFVSGAGNSLKDITDWKKFLLNRIERVIIPYWVFAAICFIITLFTYKNINLKVSFRILLSWIIPMDKQITSFPILTSALWFIPVYLCVMIIFPILRQIYVSKYRNIGVLFLSCIFFFFEKLQIGFMQKVLFYCIWTFIGFYYVDNKELFLSGVNRKRIIVIVLGILSMIGLHTLGYTFDMQLNKFPPNLMFLAYSVAIMEAVFLILPTIKSLTYKARKICFVERILNIYQKYSLSIFLYQPFVFAVTIKLAKMFGDDIISKGDGILKFLIILPVSIPACAILGRIFSKFEHLNKT